MFCSVASARHHTKEVPEQQKENFFPEMFFLEILNFPIQVIEETHLITELIQYNDYLDDKTLFCIRTSMKNIL